jgi:hypothetical protein
MSKCKHQTCTYGECKHPGDLSRRDWFAGMAMQGILGNNDVTGQIEDSVGADMLKCGKSLAQICFHLADAMIERSDKE